MNRYRIYPSLLDGYTYMCGIDDPELRAVKRQELLDSINRVPHEPIEAASRGTAMNAIMDVIKCRVRPDEKVKLQKDGGLYYAWIDGGLVDDLSAALPPNPVPQVFCSSEIEVAQGVVELYGYADYVSGDFIIDLKTTKDYTPGMFRDHWQHAVYPYCLLMSGDMEECREFVYTVAEVSEGKDGIIRGRVFSEHYPTDLAEVEDRLRNFLSYEFLPFLEDNRSEITDKKIFGGL